MELIARLRVAGGAAAHAPSGNVALFEIALDAHASMIALLTTRYVREGEALVLAEDHPTVKYRKEPWGCTVLKAFPRVEPLAAVPPPSEGMWALCDRQTLAARVASLVKVPAHRVLMVQRLRRLLPHVDFSKFTKYLADGEEEAMAAHPPNYGSPRGHEPKVAGLGEAYLRYWGRTRSGTREYFEQAEEVCFEHGHVCLGYNWFQQPLYSWPVDRIARDDRARSLPKCRAARAVERLVYLRKPAVRTTAYAMVAMLVRVQGRPRRDRSALIAVRKVLAVCNAFH